MPRTGGACWVEPMPCWAPRLHARMPWRRCCGVDWAVAWRWALGRPSMQRWLLARCAASLRARVAHSAALGLQGLGGECRLVGGIDRPAPGSCPAPARRRAQQRYREKQKAKAAAADKEFQETARELERMRLENTRLQVGAVCCRHAWVGCLPWAAGGGCRAGACGAGCTPVAADENAARRPAPPAAVCRSSRRRCSRC